MSVDPLHGEEMMIIEINYGKDGKDQRGEILVKFGDDPVVLAQKFVQDHKLKKSAVDQIYKRILTTIAEFKKTNSELDLQAPLGPDNPEEEFIPSSSCNDGKGDDGVGRVAAYNDFAPSQSTSSLERLDASPIPKLKPASGKGNDNGSSSNGPETNTLEDSKEALYNRMKMAAKHTGKNHEHENKKGHHSKHGHGSKHHGKHHRHSKTNTNSGVSEESKSSDDYGHMKDKALHLMENLPVSNSISLSVGDSRNSSTYNTDPNSAHERLYKTAKSQKEKREYLSAKSREKESQYLDQHKFTMNENSRAIMENNRLRVNNESGDYLHILHNEGVKEIERQKKLEAEKEKHKDLFVFDTRHGMYDWSCAKCGHLHSIGTQELIRKHEKKEKFVCDMCAFEKDDAIAPFKPHIYAMEQHSENGTLNHLLHRRNQAMDGHGGDIFSKLRNHDEHVQGQLTRQRAAWEKHDRMMTFQPEINEESRRILQRRIEKEAALLDIQNEDQSLPSQSISGHTDAGSSTAAVASHGHAKPSQKHPNQSVVMDRLAHGRDSSSLLVHPMKSHLGTTEHLDRAGWTSARIVNDHKLDKSKGTSYTHDARPTSTAEYFSKPVIKRLSQNLKPYIRQNKGSTATAGSNIVPSGGESVIMAGSDDDTSLNMNQVIPGDGSVISGVTGVDTINDGRKILKTGTIQYPGRHSENTYVKPVPDRMRKKMGAKEAKSFAHKMNEWAEKQKIKRQLEEEKASTWDTKNNRPLFRPKIGPAPSGAGFGTQLSVDQNGTHAGDRYDRFVAKLYTKAEESKKRLEALRKKQEEAQQSQLEVKKVAALPNSTHILREAREKSIEEMFRLLLVASSIENDEDTANDDALDRAVAISSMSEQVDDIDNATVDLSIIQPDMMIPEVSSLLAAVLEERYKHIQDSGNDDEMAMCVTYKEFHALIIKCLSKREGPGKFYVYAPKKKADVVMAMKMEEENEITFAPVINHNSQDISRQRFDNGDGTISKEFEQKLAKEAERVEKKRMLIRKEHEARERKEMTFKPKLYKPPAHIQPRYRGMMEDVGNDVPGQGSPSSPSTLYTAGGDSMGMQTPDHVFLSAPNSKSLKGGGSNTSNSTGTAVSSPSVDKRDKRKDEQASTGGSGSAPVSTGGTSGSRSASMKSTSQKVNDAIKSASQVAQDASFTPVAKAVMKADLEYDASFTNNTLIDSVSPKKGSGSDTMGGYSSKYAASNSSSKEGKSKNQAGKVPRDTTLTNTLLDLARSDNTDLDDFQVNIVNVVKK